MSGEAPGPAARTYALRLVDAAGRVALARGGLRAGAQPIDVSGVDRADRGAVLYAGPLRVE